jgi:hypothetical protein
MHLSLYPRFINETRAVNFDECRVLQFHHPWCKGWSQTKPRRWHETLLLTTHVLPLFASWGDVVPLVSCPGYIEHAVPRNGLVITVLRRIGISRRFIVYKYHKLRFCLLIRDNISLTFDLLSSEPYFCHFCLTFVLITGYRGDRFLNEWFCVPHDSGFRHRFQRRFCVCVCGGGGWGASAWLYAMYRNQTRKPII